MSWSGRWGGWGRVRFWKRLLPCSWHLQGPTLVFPNLPTWGHSLLHTPKQGTLHLQSRQITEARRPGLHLGWSPCDKLEGVLAPPRGFLFPCLRNKEAEHLFPYDWGPHCSFVLPGDTMQIFAHSPIVGSLFSPFISRHSLCIERLQEDRLLAFKVIPN